MDSENRRFPRFPAQFQVRYFVEDQLEEGETANLSVSGAFVVTARLPLMNRLLTLKVFPGHSQQAVTIEARVVRVVETGFGVEWIQAVVPINPQPLRSFLHEILGITRGFIRKIEDANGIPRFMYRFSYPFLEKMARDASADEASADSGAMPLSPLPEGSVVPVSFTTRGGKFQARMVGGYDNGLILQSGPPAPQVFDRLDVAIFPDDRRRRVELKGLVSRVKPVEPEFKIYIRLTLDNDQKELARFRDLALALRN
jgi:hypothetical protein